MLDAGSEDPRSAPARRPEDRVALCIDLDRKPVDERNRDAASHRRRPLRSESVHTLQVALRSNAAEPADHHLFSADAIDILLVHEAAAIAGLLDSRLHLDQPAGSGPSSGGDPMIARRAIANHDLAGRRRRALDVPEKRGCIHVELTDVAAQAEPELALA